MIVTSETVIGRIACARGNGESLSDLAGRAVDALGADPAEVGGVIVATFSNPERFPSLAVRLASRLGLPPETPAFDLQMACSAYPYALYLAGKIAADTGRHVIVVDGDVQSPLVDPSDHATGAIFSDAMTASLVRSGTGRTSKWAFLSRCDEALACSAAGPIRMDGFKVFSFVATEVNLFLKDFLAASGATPAFFAPHQANPYMVRQLARSLGLEDRLLTLDESVRNPGSCSVALTLAAAAERVAGAEVLVAGFGAGYSAAVGTVRTDDGFSGKVL